MMPLSKASYQSSFVGSYWYYPHAMGHNMLGQTVRWLRQKAGILGYFINHSLHATAATQLFENHVDEQLIMQHTGHSTTSGVRSCRRAKNYYI